MVTTADACLQSHTSKWSNLCLVSTDHLSFMNITSPYEVVGGWKKYFMPSPVKVSISHSYNIY